MVSFSSPSKIPRNISVLLGLPDPENGGMPGTTHRTKRRGVPNGVGFAIFEKSELQGNVWQDTVMAAINRQDRHK